MCIVACTSNSPRTKLRRCSTPRRLSAPHWALMLTSSAPLDTKGSLANFARQSVKRAAQLHIVRSTWHIFLQLVVPTLADFFVLDLATRPSDVGCCCDRKAECSKWGPNQLLRRGVSADRRGAGRHLVLLFLETNTTLASLRL